MPDKKSILSDRSLKAQLSFLGKAVAGRRLALDWTQAELAEQSGVSPATLRRLEAGESTQLGNFLRVLRALGLVDELAALAAGPDPFEDVRAERGQATRQRASGGRRRAAAPFTWGDGGEPLEADE